jgi:hypothetical protein
MQAVVGMRNLRGSHASAQKHRNREYVGESIPVLQSNSEEAGPPGFDLRYWSSWRLFLISSPLGATNTTPLPPGVRPFLGKTYKFHKTRFFSTTAMIITVTK